MFGYQFKECQGAYSRLSVAFVVDSVHAFKLWFSVRKKRSPASPIGMVNLNCDWFFKLVKNSSLECACYFCHLAAWTSDSPGCRKFFSLLRHLSRSTEFLWIFNAELLKKSSMPVFSSQEIFYWVICARQTYCLCCLSDKVSILLSIYYDVRLNKLSHLGEI